MLNSKLKEKLSEVLPNLQLDLIDDFRQRETMDLVLNPEKPLEHARGSPLVIGPEDNEHTGEFFNIESLPIQFLEGLDWGALENPDFDVIVGIPGALNGISDGSGSSGTNCLESIEGRGDHVSRKSEGFRLWLNGRHRGAWGAVRFCHHLLVPRIGQLEQRPAGIS